MSHHLVTVCMVCLLCASHTCGSHYEIQHDLVNVANTGLDDAKIVEINHEGKSKNVEEERKLRYQQKLDKIRSQRPKREVIVDPDAYLTEIFNMYGDPDSMTMNLTGFNRMMESLDFEKLVDGGLQKDEKKDYIYGQDDSLNVMCINSDELVTKVNSLQTPLHDHHHHHDHQPNLITEDTLQSICPILLYQKLANTSLERLGCVKRNNNFETRKVRQNEVSLENAYSKNTFSVWLYSSLSITAISACGLLGVAVIPIMHKTYYNHILQFLVALAVGTLCGDALLHLMPHAMSPIEGTLEIDHDDGMWKGLAAMMGVVFFYFTEKGLTVVVEWRKRRQKLNLENKLPSRVRVLKDEKKNSNSLLKIFKKDEKKDTTSCKHKYSEYPYCYDEIETDTHGEHHHPDGQAPPSPKAKVKNSVSIVSSNALNSENKEEQSQKDWLLKDNPAVVEMNNIKEDGPKDGGKDGDSYTVILREHSRAHHGHSHSHGHVHAPPSSMSSVAWMVIMGDGLHNFTDGMAIGAAFASNIAGGFSTAIAVLCHELPHELGDFAVLLKAGMSVKRAVWYNVLSSALCLGGMICGVLAGHAPSATRWLFATAAGMFLYIALVDMMPELSTSHSKEGTLCQCLLQLMGLGSGIGIMLIIAMYEHDLKNLFG